MSQIELFPVGSEGEPMSEVLDQPPAEEGDDSINAPDDAEEATEEEAEDAPELDDDDDDDE